MQKQKPTATELEILNLLWKGGKMSVKQINDGLNKVRDVGYTTSLKMLQIMYEKGLADREKEGRGHLYFAKVEEKDIKNSMLDGLLESAFGGSASNLVIQLLNNKNTSKKEIDKIKELLKNIER